MQILLAFLVTLAAAILRGFVAGAAGESLEPALAARFPALPHPACHAIALVSMVIAVEIAALIVERLLDRFGRHE